MEDNDSYRLYPHHRKWFNKLYVAELFGYDCGPAGVAPTKDGTYVIRPIYNLSGMGVGAEVKEIKAGDLTMVPAGYFWCEYFVGNHFSIDYKRENNVWIPFSAMIGTHENEDNLVKFEVWEKIEIPNLELPDFIQKIDVEYINVESKNDKIFEIHLRPGNKEIWNLPMGSKLHPLWEDDVENDKKSLKFLENKL